jgi:hypothetical protein
MALGAVAHGRLPIRRRRWAARALLVGVLACLAFAPAAQAQETGGDADIGIDDQIILNGRLLVRGGERVGAAVIFNGPATVEGTVGRSLVVFNGATEISGTVAENVVVFNGTVVVRSGAEIGGDLVTQQTPQVEDGAVIRGSQQRVTTRFDAEGLGLASRIAWWVGYSASTLILGLLLLLLAPGVDAAIVDAVRNRTGASIGFGAVAFFLIPIAAVLFLVILVAIPLGLFVLLALALIYTIGYVAGAHAIGRLLVKPPSSRFLAFLAGWGILRLLALIPVAAGVVWFLAAIFGLGVIAVAARRTPITQPAPAVPPPPVPT